MKIYQTELMHTQRSHGHVELVADERGDVAVPPTVGAQLPPGQVRWVAKFNGTPKHVTYCLK